MKRLTIGLLTGGLLAMMVPGVAAADQPPNLGQCIVQRSGYGTPADDTVFHVGAAERPGSPIGPGAMVDGYDTAFLAGGQLGFHIPMTLFVQCAKP